MKATLLNCHREYEGPDEDHVGLLQVRLAGFVRRHEAENGKEENGKKCSHSNGKWLSRPKYGHEEDNECTLPFLSWPLRPNERGQKDWSDEGDPRAPCGQWGGGGRRSAIGRLDTGPFPVHGSKWSGRGETETGKVDVQMRLLQSTSEWVIRRNSKSPRDQQSLSIKKQVESAVTSFISVIGNSSSINT